MKNKLVSMLSIIVLLFTSLISVNAIALAPRVDLDEYQVNITDKNNVYVSGTVSVAKGQNIAVYDSTGKYPFATQIMGTSGGSESFRIKIDPLYLHDGTNEFKVKSMALKGVLNSSNPKTFTVIIKSNTKKNQTITASNISVTVGESKNINAKVSSNLSLTYKVENSSIATVDTKGKVIGRTVGTTKVTITQAGNSEYNATSKVITITVTKQATPPKVSRYKVTFNANGGKGSSYSQTIEGNKNTKLTSNKFKRTGYTFKGWATNKSSTKPTYKNNQAITINKNITLYAVWSINDWKTSNSYVKKGNHIWNIYSEIKNKISYHNMQCLACDNTFLYAVFRNGGSNYGKIVKFDLGSQKVVKISDKMYLGHANDMTYNPKDNCLYVTRDETLAANGSSLKITKVNANTLNSKGAVTTVIPSKFKAKKYVKAYNGIAYKDGSMYLRARYGASYILKINQNYKVTKTYKYRAKNSSYPCHQGMDFKGNSLYVAASKDHKSNSCIVYTGKLSSNTNVKSHGLKTSGELEGVFKFNGKMYAGIKKASGKIYIIKL